MIAKEKVWTYPQLEVEDGVARVTLTQPQSLNALYPEALAELTDLFRSLKDEAGIFCVLLRGAGDKAFVAGADIKRMSQMSAQEAWKFAREGQEMLSLLEDLPQVTVAQVHGFALGGGCELALACDLIYASEQAVMGQPEVGLGLIPGFGGTVRLHQRVGIGKARELILRGHRLDAQEAYRIGLIDGLFAADQLPEQVEKVIADFRKKSPHALSQAKRSLQFALFHDRDTALQFEAELFSECFKHPDQKEGTAAFVSKRQPQWSHR